MARLDEKSCVPCRQDSPPLAPAERQELQAELKDWSIVDDHHLEREFKFRDFKSALEWVNKVGAIAEAEGHHPDLYLAWGTVRVTIWSHAINNLTISDFVLAAKIDRLFTGGSSG